MTLAPILEDDGMRVAGLRRYNILDSEAQKESDLIVKLAATIGAPIAYISLIDEQRQWIKTCIGAQTAETPRFTPISGPAMVSGDVMVLSDASADPCFADNPDVCGGLRITLLAAEAS